MRVTPDARNTAPATDVADAAVGVPENKWFIAIVNHNSELRVNQALDALGYRSYAATQEEMRVRSNGRRVRIQRVVIPSNVFIFCTEAQRRQIVALPYIKRFMTDIAATPGAAGNRPPAVVTPAEMHTLRFMLGAADTPVTLADRPFTKGERVRVIRGNLRGLTGEISADPDGPHTLTIRLPLLGYARVSIDPASVAHLP